MSTTVPATQEQQEGQSDTDESTLPPPFRDLPDDPPPGERPRDIYPDCPFCYGYITPSDDHPHPTCVACATTPLGVPVLDEDERHIEYQPPIGPHADEDRPRYRNSKRVRMNGGFDHAYPDESTQTERDAELGLFDNE